MVTGSALPPPPRHIGEPLVIGGVPIPSRFFLAPMAGYTSLAFRLAVRAEGGLGLVTTDLVNARSILEDRRRSRELSETCLEDRPVAIQLYGHVIEEMREAARRMVERGATLIDINMGCPVRKVVRSGGGSALMCDAGPAQRLVAGVVEAVAPVPVTVKMRLGWDAETLSAPGLARDFERVGASAVIIHGRTRQQGFKGQVNREGIRAVVEAVERVPIIGNGDVRTIADADQMFRETGCAAVSIGRGALANPFVFRQLAHWAREGTPGPEPTFEERIGLMERHFFRLVESVGERYACLQFRKTVKWYGHLVRPPRTIYLRMINLPDTARFVECIEALRAVGPVAPLPDHLGPRVPVPSGPVERW